MTPEEIRKAMGAISAQIEEIVPDGEYTDEQVQSINALNEDFEKLSTQLETAEKVEGMKAKATASNRKTPAVIPAQKQTTIEVGASGTDRFGGFKSSAEFINAVKNASKGIFAPQFQNLQREAVGEEGGFLVPTDISTVIWKKFQDEGSLLARVNTMPVSGNSMTIPVDETSPWNGGAVSYWVDEGMPIPTTKIKFANAELKLKKVGCIIKATDELLEDTVALESQLKNAASSALVHKVNAAIISGDGVGKPLGFLNSPFAVTVAKESAQAADTIVAANVIKMASRLLPQSRANAVWMGNVAAVAALNGLTDSNGDYIFLKNGTGLNQGPYDTLLGMPILPFLAGFPALGDSGDLVLVDLSYYWAIVKSGGVKTASSIHLHFDREITAFRFTMRIDGKVPFQTPVNPEFGTFPMSAIVKLADRA